MELHLTGAFGVDEILKFNNSGEAGEWNFPRWFPLLQPGEGMSLSKTSDVPPHPDAVLLVINLNNEVWQSVKDKLRGYKSAVLVQTEAYLGWEVAYENCREFDFFLNFDASYSWHPGFLQFNLPYDPTVASSHLDRRGWRSLIATAIASPREVLRSATRRLLPRKDKAVMISTLQTADRYRIRLDAARANKDRLDVYGGGWPADLPNYRGRCASKIGTLRMYKYALVFENQRQPGYITEKLLDCFVANTVPFYWGAPDVSDYIPHDTFLLPEDILSTNALPDQQTYRLYARQVRRAREQVFEKFSVNQFVAALRLAVSLASRRKTVVQ